MNYWDHVAEGNGNYYWGDFDNKARQLLIKLIENGESVLDVGCGTGFAYELIKRSGKQISYQGFDYSEKMIEHCHKRYPEASFIVKRVEQLTDYPDNSFDTVYSRHGIESYKDWAEAVKQMFRVARKQVIIDSRRHLTDKPSSRGDVEGDTCCWDINYDEFNHLARTLSDNVSYLQELVGDSNTFVVIGKKMQNIVFTLDDFAVDNHNLDLLLKIKEQSPKMKVTLFAIPTRCPPWWLRELKEKYPWMEFAMHGWYHFTDRGSQEADQWTKEDALKRINQLEDEFGDLFVKGFKAPGWQMCPATYEALKEKGYWVMDGEWLKHLRPEGFTNYYETQHLWEVNGHVQRTPYNGLIDIIEAKNPFTKDSDFYFVSEMVGTEKDKVRLKELAK